MGFDQLNTFVIKIRFALSPQSNFDGQSGIRKEVTSYKIYILAELFFSV